MFAGDTRHCHDYGHRQTLTEEHGGSWVVCHSCYLIADFSEEIHSMLSPHSRIIVINISIALGSIDPEGQTPLLKTCLDDHWFKAGHSGNVPSKATALKRWRQIARLWKRKERSSRPAWCSFECAQSFEGDWLNYVAGRNAGICLALPVSSQFSCATVRLNLDKNLREDG